MYQHRGDVFIYSIYCNSLFPVYFTVIIMVNITGHKNKGMNDRIKNMLSVYSKNI